jgi:hypothetical protein
MHIFFLKGMNLLIVTINDKKNDSYCRYNFNSRNYSLQTAILPVNVENETIAPAKKKL